MKNQGILPAVFIAADGATQMIRLERPPQDYYDLELKVQPRDQPKGKDWKNRRTYRLIEVVYNPLNGQLLAVYREVINV